MTLEFKLVFDQVAKMGAIDFDLSDRLQIAIERFDLCDVFRQRIDCERLNFHLFVGRGSHTRRLNRLQPFQRWVGNNISSAPLVRFCMA